MKKTFVVLLILAVASGAFAQVTPFGNVRLDFGATVNMGDGNDKPAQWAFGLSGDATSFGVGVGDDDAGGQVLIRMDGNLRANGWVNVGPVQLAVGNGEFFGQWGSVGFWGWSGWGSGCSALGGQNPWIKVSASGFFGGLHEGGVSGKFIATDYDAKMGSDVVYSLDEKTGLPKASTKTGEYAPFPAFFAGYDMTIDGVASFGALFAGQFVGEAYGDDGKFPLLFNVHGKLLMLDPITIGLNIGLYMAPSHAPALFEPLMYGNPIGKEGSGKSMVLETMADFCIPLDPCTIGISASFLTDLASKKDGGGHSWFKLGAGARFGIGDTGFSITPGVMYANLLKFAGSDGKASTFDLGVSLGYNF